MKTRLESQNLHVFVTLARTLNMSEAARELGQTPSAISHALKSLETSMGCSIFERSPRHMTLLPIGHALLPDAIEILDRLSLLRSKANTEAGNPKTEIRLSVTPNVIEYLIPRALKTFSLHYPDCAVQIHQDATTRGIADLGHSNVDLVIIAEPAFNPALDFTMLGEDELRLTLHAQHEWAGITRLPLAKLQSRTLLVSDCDDTPPEWISAYFKKVCPEITPQFEWASEQTISSRLNAHTSIALLPKWTVAPHLRSRHLTQLHLGRVSLKRKWMLATRKSYPLSTAEAALVKIIKSLFTKVMSA